MSTPTNNAAATAATDQTTEPSEPPVKLPLHENKDIRQFVKFCIVGVSSSIVNFGLFNLFYQRMNLALFFSYTLAFLCAVLNGFIWNRAWTFKEKRGRSVQTQGLRFFLVNIVGLALNNGIAVSVISFFTSDNEGFGSARHIHDVMINCISGTAKHHYPALLTNGALLVATCVVVFWNYFANRHWTFKH